MECDIVTNDDDDDVDGWMRSCVLPACGFRLFWLDWGCTSVTRWADGGLSILHVGIGMKSDQIWREIMGNLSGGIAVRGAMAMVKGEEHHGRGCHGACRRRLATVDERLRTSR